MSADRRLELLSADLQAYEFKILSLKPLCHS